MNKAEKEHLSKVASVGCIVCRNIGFGESPAEIHHVRTGQGMGQRASNYEAIPLCPFIIGWVDMVWPFTQDAKSLSAFMGLK